MHRPMSLPEPSRSTGGSVRDHRHCDALVTAQPRSVSAECKAIPHEGTKHSKEHDRQELRPVLRALRGEPYSVLIPTGKSIDRSEAPRLPRPGQTTVARPTDDEDCYASIFNAARNADCGISTLPNCRIRFLPSFCFSSSLRLRV